MDTLAADISSVGSAASSIIASLGVSGVLGTTSQQQLLIAQQNAALAAQNKLGSTSMTTVLLIGAGAILLIWAMSMKH